MVSSPARAGSAKGPPDAIVLLRHGEKPAPNKPPFGVNVHGNRSLSSLVPHGWQRAGGLAALFHLGPGPLTIPNQLYSLRYKTHKSTIHHRTYETILPLMHRLNLEILSPFGDGEEQKLAEAIVANDAGTSLVCWEHHRIPIIASHIPVAEGQQVPASWPGDRYDVIWLFTLATAAPVTYTFAQVPQLLLYGDTGI